MPRFFLDIFNSEICATDDDGQELPDLAAAREAAITGIRSILGGELARGKLDLRGEIRIRDDAGNALLSVPYSEAVAIRE